MNNFAASSSDPPPRNSSKVIYPGFGRCIYCGATEGRLSDEHIIPFSLGGLLIIEKASCSACAKITCNFEGAVARSLFGDFRMRHKLPTRRPKERPTRIPLQIVSQTRPDIPLSLPVAEFPAPAFMYKCTRAGILQGLPPTIDTAALWQIVGIASDAELKAFYAKYGKHVAYSFRHVPEQFARMLAKIGHSYAVVTFGLEAFKPLAVETVLGQMKNLSYVVGGSFDIEPPVPDAGHLLSAEIATNGITSLITVGIRLFGSCATPSYHVVAGVAAGVPQAKVRSV